MKEKWLKNGKEAYRQARKEGWILIEKMHDGILMPEYWERKNKSGEWEFEEAYDGFGHLIGPDGKKMMKLW